MELSLLEWMFPDGFIPCQYGLYAIPMSHVSLTEIDDARVVEFKVWRCVQCGTLRATEPDKTYIGTHKCVQCDAQYALGPNDPMPEGMHVTTGYYVPGLCQR